MILADCECGGAEADYIPVNRCLCVEKVVWTLQQMTGNHGVTLTECLVKDSCQDLDIQHIQFILKI